MGQQVLRVEFEEASWGGYVYLTSEHSPTVAYTLPLGDCETAESVPAARDLLLDFDQDNRLIGIEVLNARQWLREEVLDSATEP
jgi:uncharacterized protein YuzE